MEYSSFLSNDILQKAICWNFNIIGEASRNIQKNDPEYLENNPDIPWIDAYEMRNHIVHGYWKVDPEIIWRTIDNELPEMSKQLSLLLDRNEDNKPT